MIIIMMQVKAPNSLWGSRWDGHRDLNLKTKKKKIWYENIVRLLFIIRIEKKKVVKVFLDMMICNPGWLYVDWKIQSNRL